MKYFKISAVLAAIALVCSVIIASINLLTSPVIARNEKQTELQTIQKIFTDYDEDKSSTVLDVNESITKKILAADKDGKALGNVYIVTGKNSYGKITLMVAIKDGSLLQVEFITNEQSYSSTVDAHLSANYPSSDKSSIQIGFAPKASDKVGTLTEENVENVDVKCGATFGAKLVKELIQKAFEDYNTAN